MVVFWFDLVFVIWLGFGYFGWVWVYLVFVLVIGLLVTCLLLLLDFCYLVYVCGLLCCCCFWFVLRCVVYFLSLSLVGFVFV